MSINGSSVSDIIALAGALNAKKEGDREFQDTLNELSATLAELKEFFEKFEGKEDSAALDAMKDMASAIQDAVKAMSNMKPPNVTVQAPAASGGQGWKKLKVQFDTSPNGFIQGATIERA